MVRLHRDLFELLRCYTALVPSKFLTYPSRLRVVDVHDFLLNNILFNKQLAAYPPSDRYQQSFWKWAIYHLEEAINKASEVRIISANGCGPERHQSRKKLKSTRAFMNITCRCCPHHSEPRFFFDVDVTEDAFSSVVAQAPPPPPSYVTYFWRYPIDDDDQETIDIDSYQIATLLESCTTIERGTTGLRTWLASFVLSQYLISHPGMNIVIRKFFFECLSNPHPTICSSTEIIAHKRILELGCGAGFMGIVVATLQKLVAPQENHALWLSDINEEVLARCYNNVQLTCSMYFLVCRYSQVF
jgi:hypothetical protein